MWSRIIKLMIFLYIVVFVYLSYLAVADNIENHYPLLFVAWSVAMYVLLNIGNIIYIIGAKITWIKDRWHFVFWLGLAFFFFAYAMDSYVHHNEREELVPLLIGFLVFLPTFFFNFKLCGKLAR